MVFDNFYAHIERKHLRKSNKQHIVMSNVREEFDRDLKLVPIINNSFEIDDEKMSCFSLSNHFYIITEF